MKGVVVGYGCIRTHSMLEGSKYVIGLSFRDAVGPKTVQIKANHGPRHQAFTLTEHIFLLKAYLLIGITIGF